MKVFGLVLTLGIMAAVGCTRDPQRGAASHDENTEGREIASGPQDATDGGTNSYAPAPASGDARQPANTGSGELVQSDAKNASGEATSVGTLGSPRAQDAQPMPVNSGVSPKDGKGVVGSKSASNIGSANPSGQGSQLDVSRYTYDKRNEFKSFMSARLEGVDRNLKTLSERSDAKEGGGSVVLKDLTKKRSDLNSKLGSISGVKREAWDQYKQSFRDEVAVLERSVQDISTASTATH